jgi:hypothetical protein
MSGVSDFNKHINERNKKRWIKEQVRRKNIGQRFTSKGFENAKIYLIKINDDPALTYVTSINQIVTKYKTTEFQMIDKEQKKLKKYYKGSYICNLYGYYEEYYWVLYDVLIEYYENGSKLSIELYENYECSNEGELLSKEKEIINRIGTLNKIIHNKTKEQLTQLSSIIPEDEYLL